MTRVRAVLSNFLFFSSGIIVSFGIEQWLNQIKTLSPLLLLLLTIATILGAVLIKPKPDVRTKYINRTRVKEKKALIGLVSTYKWLGDSKNKKTLNDCSKIIDAGNEPEFNKTNLGPLVGVIEQYKKLDKIWLISTKESINSAALLAEYLVKIKKYGSDNIFYGNEWYVKDPFSVLTPNDTKNLILRAHEEAKGEFKPTEIVTDITGGVKGMQVGAILACVNPDMDVQYSLTNRSTGSLESTIYTFEIEVIS